MRNLKYLLADAVKYKSRLHKLDFIGSLLQEKVKNSVFVKFYSRYAEYFPEYSSYFLRDLRLMKSMYRLTESEKYLLMS